MRGVGRRKAGRQAGGHACVCVRAPVLGLHGYGAELLCAESCCGLTAGASTIVPLPPLPFCSCCRRFLCLSGKSQSPVVARLHAARDTGRLSPRDERTFLRWVVGWVAGYMLPPAAAAGDGACWSACDFAAWSFCSGTAVCIASVPYPPLHYPAPLLFRCTCRVLSLRGALSHYLLQLSADPRSPVLFRCTSSSSGSSSGAANGHGGSLEVAGLMPTLFLVKDALLQASAAAGSWRGSCPCFCRLHLHTAAATLC